MAPARDRDRAELLLACAELVHVPARDRREVHGLGEPAHRDLEVLLEQLLGVALPGTADHLRALRRPRDAEGVEDVRSPCPSRSACAASYGAVAAQRIPPPALDSHMSWSVPKCAWNAATSNCSGERDVHEAVDVGGLEARRRRARARRPTPTISATVRPDAFVWSDSPTPQIATAPLTSSYSVAQPQLSVRSVAHVARPAGVPMMPGRLERRRARRRSSPSSPPRISRLCSPERGRGRVASSASASRLAKRKGTRRDRVLAGDRVVLGARSTRGAAAAGCGRCRGRRRRGPRGRPRRRARRPWPAASCDAHQRAELVVDAVVRGASAGGGRERGVARPLRVAERAREGAAHCSSVADRDGEPLLVARARVHVLRRARADHGCRCRSSSVPARAVLDDLLGRRVERGLDHRHLDEAPLAGASRGRGARASSRTRRASRRAGRRRRGAAAADRRASR